MSTPLTILLVGTIVSVTSVAAYIPADPDTGRTVPQLIEAHGLGCETHHVTTEDGYILQVHRIVANNNNTSNNTNLKPVIINHGLFGSSADFLINSPFLVPPDNQSALSDNLPFALLDRYDVWLANNRGNPYGQRHRTLSTGDRRFWNFSFDQMAEFDLPATIEHVLNVTGFATVGYVGYSQGTTSMFALLTIRPEWAAIVQPFVALAPVTFLGNTRSPLARLSSLEWALKSHGGQFLPIHPIASQLVDMACRGAPTICSNLFFLIGGYDSPRLNQSRVPVYSSYYPSATSSWSLAHWAQGVNSGRFQHFDYGHMGNLLKYRRWTAPDWQLGRIDARRAKIALIHGRGDWLSTSADVARLKSELHRHGVRLIDDYVVPDPGWTHIDFTLARGAGELIYRRVLDVLDRYTTDHRL